MPNKLTDIIGLTLCALGFVASFAGKNYVACALWVLVAIGDMRSIRLIETIEIQKEIIDLKEKRIQQVECLYKTIVSSISGHKAANEEHA